MLVAVVVHFVKDAATPIIVIITEYMGKVGFETDKEKQKVCMSHSHAFLFLRVLEGCFSCLDSSNMVAYNASTIPFNMSMLLI